MLFFEMFKSCFACKGRVYKNVRIEHGLSQKTIDWKSTFPHVILMARSLIGFVCLVCSSKASYSTNNSGVKTEGWLALQGKSKASGIRLTDCATKQFMLILVYVFWGVRGRGRESCSWHV